MFRSYGAWMFLRFHSTKMPALRALGWFWSEIPYVVSYVYFSRWHGDADGLAPDADLRVVETVDRLVSPLHGGGGEGLRVGVAGRGVNGQQHKTFAVGAIHLDFATVQKGAVAAPAPFHIPLIAHDGNGNDRLKIVFNPCFIRG